MLKGRCVCHHLTTTMNVPPAELRREYTREGLHETTVLDDPIAQFRRWFEDALAANHVDANAMTLATVDAAGKPAARIVLLKGFDASGFTFFTNYESRKAQDLMAHPHAALVFWWHKLERQVRIEGTVERVPDDESEAYFQSRPRGSRLGAWASPQSQPIAGRETLEEALDAVTARFEDQEIPRPPHWGGYRVRPTSIEFWQGRPSRLHDRLVYEKTEKGWTLQRLAP